MLWLLLIVLGITGVTYLATNVVTMLNTLSWCYTIYMIFRIMSIMRKRPDPRRYAPPPMVIPDTIDRDHLPTFTVGEAAASSDPIVQLVRAICTKIAHAADESALHAFIQGKLATMRRTIHERYAPAGSEVNVIGFEGIIGTLIGLVSFMAQATVLFRFPAIQADNFDTTDFVLKMAENLRTVDLLTVSTAFFTSIIGWGAKAYIGGWLDHQMSEEMASLTGVERWVQDELLARLSMPSQIETIARIADLPDLREPVERVAGLLSAVAAELGPSFATISRTLRQLGTLAFSVEYVKGGVRLRPYDDSGEAGGQGGAA